MERGPRQDLRWDGRGLKEVEGISPSRPPFPYRFTPHSRLIRQTLHGGAHSDVSPRLH